MPSATKLTLDNGLTVYLVENHALPVVSAELVARAGSASDGGKPGLAGFTSAMLDEGTEKRDALAIARDLEALGASLGVDVGRDGTTLGVRSLKQNAAKTLDIMSDVVLHPTFPQQEIERVRNDRLTSLLQDRDSPFRIAYTVMWAELYGPENPYGHMVIGTEPGLKGITRDDLHGFYSSAFTPANAALVLTGDLSESEAKQLANQTFGQWKGSGAPPPLNAGRGSTPEKVLVVDRPNMPQTAVVVAQIGVERKNPDYEKLTVMNQVMGGLFSSRLNLNLREKHGYTYGASSNIYDTTHEGPWMLAAQVREDATGASISEMIKEAKGMLEKEVTPEELKLAKESISRSLPAQFMTSQSTAGTIGSLFLYDLPPDYYQNLPKRIEDMSAADVFTATKAHLMPDSMKVIAVGDRKKIDSQIAALKLGPVGYRLPDGSPVSATEKVHMPIP